MDSSIRRREDAARQAKRLIEEFNGQNSASAAHRHDTTSRLFATQEEILRAVSKNLAAGKDDPNFARFVRRSGIVHRLSGEDYLR
jgi:hypothetical protein